MKTKKKSFVTAYGDYLYSKTDPSESKNPTRISLYIVSILNGSISMFMGLSTGAVLITKIHEGKPFSDLKILLVTFILSSAVSAIAYASFKSTFGNLNNPEEPFPLSNKIMLILLSTNLT
jgi:hypothetical protein